MLSVQKIHPAALWTQCTELSASDVDCITTIMLKILDGKCKMFPQEKEVITIIYDVTKHQQGNILGEDIHTLIRQARLSMSEDLVEKIYEQRLYAETMVSRPVMKAFKAMLRKNGIIGNTI